MPIFEEYYKGKLKGNNIDYRMGYGGQFIIMALGKNLIIVPNNHDIPKGIEQQINFLNKKLPKLIETYGKQSNG